MDKTIMMRNPAELRLHPLKRLMPKGAEWQAGGDRLNELADDIREHGIRQPLLINDEGLILDGDVRARAAKQLQIAEVPVIVVSEAPATVILSCLMHRQHLTKSGRAYLAFPLVETALNESKARRLQNLRKGQQTPEHALSAGSGSTLSETTTTVAQRLGISPRLLQQAAEVHAIFARDVEFKALMEPNILSDDPEDSIGLGRVIAGYGGRDATAGKTKRTHEQLKLFTEVVEDQFCRIKYWQGLDDNGKRQVWKEVDRLAQEVEPEQVEGLIEFHKAMASRLEKTLKEVIR